MASKATGNTGKKLGAKIRLGVLFGGRSGEHEVSIASALSVYKFLDPSRYEITLIAIDKDGRWLLPSPDRLLAQADDPMHAQVEKTNQHYGVVPHPGNSPLVPLERASGAESPVLPRLDVIFPLLHGTFGEDGTVQGLLELAQVPYVGSGVLGSALGMDKDVARQLLRAAGIQVVPTLSLRRHDYDADANRCTARILNEFNLPFFVKPANAGSSVGVHKVKSESALAPALKDAFQYDRKVLIEKGINARELEISVLGNDEPRVSVIGEAIPHHEFYDYEAKYLDPDGVSFAIPAPNLPTGVAERINDWAKLAFRTLECGGMARVDFFLDRKTNELYLNEINTIPGFTSVSMYPKMWEASGLAYRDLLDELIRLALERHEHRQSLKTTFTPSDDST